MVASLRPTGKFQMQELYEAGGVRAIMRELLLLLHGESLTVTGETVAANVSNSPESGRRDVVATLAEPFAAEGGLAVLRGNLAPDGAIIKHAAASPKLLQHRGKAIVFDSVEEMTRRVNDPELEVTAENVLVLRNAGPVGGPGMPEAGMIPIPAKLLAQGVRDMVRLSDARMSGTAYGTVVLHIAPEAAVGGPLAAVQEGDEIVLDVEARTLSLLVPDEEIQRRLAARPPFVPGSEARRGYGWLYAKHVLQADQGCDFDFCAADWNGADRTTVSER
jgi:dihydroxy-acid dehydratase